MRSIKLTVTTDSIEQNVVLEADTVTNDQTEMRKYVLNPPLAVEVANSMLHAAEVCGVEVHVQTTRGITDMQRLALIARTGHIMRTMAKAGPQKTSMQIVDSILAEVL